MPKLRPEYLRSAASMHRALILPKGLLLLKSTNWWQVARWICAFLVGFVFTGGALRIGSFVHIGPGLDPSWIASIGEATSRGDIFGKDIIFTLGPLNSVYTRYFDPLMWRWTLGVGMLAAISIGLSLAELRGTLALTLLTTALALSQSSDPLLASLPLFACVSTLTGPRPKQIALSIGAIASGALMLVKFTMFPVAAVTFICVDILHLSRRQMPIAILLFVGTSFLCFTVIQGNSGSFPAFIWYSFQTSFGYTDAMSLWGSTNELLCGLFSLALLATIICWREILRFRVQSQSPFSAIATVLSFGIYLFFIWKAGFVRQDRHSLIFWGGISLAACLYFQAYKQMIARTLVTDTLIIGLSVVALGIGIYERQFASGSPIQYIAISRLTEGANMVSSLADLTINPHSWLNNLKSAREAARSNLAQSQPLPPLLGSVDSVPSIQSRLIANGWDYRPQFTVQEYVGYTETLIAKNQAGLEGPRSPENILFAPSSIDYHYPASANGASWPEFLRHYEPRRMVDDLLILSRRKEPLPSLLGPAVVTRARLGQPFQLDRKAIFLKIDVQLTLLGRLYSFLFKSPAVTMWVRYGDEQEDQYRLIPAQAREGFLISPTVSTARDYLALSMPPTRNNILRMPETITIDVTGKLRGAYAKELIMTLQPVDLDKVIEADAQNLLVKAYETQP